MHAQLLRIAAEAAPATAPWVCIGSHLTAGGGSSVGGTSTYSLIHQIEGARFGIPSRFIRTNAIALAVVVDSLNWLRFDSIV